MVGVVTIDREQWSESTREVRDCLERWGLRDIEIRSFRYVETLSDRDDEACVRDLMHSSDWLCDDQATPCVVVPLRTTVLSLDFFDSLQGQPPAPISSNGHLRQCPQAYMEGIAVHDELRKLLVRIERKTRVDGTPAEEEEEEEEEESVMTEEIVDENSTTEFIFHLFSLLVVGGGSMCQPDETVDAYLSTTKSLYRHLLTVVRRPDANGNNNIAITTKAYRVYGNHLFKNENRLQRCYVLLDRRTRVATILYNKQTASSW